MRLRVVAKRKNGSKAPEETIGAKHTATIGILEGILELKYARGKRWRTKKPCKMETTMI